jgi:N-acetylmuramoyl-L-alanine amidase
MGLAYITVFAPDRDTPLPLRVGKANKYAKFFDGSIYLSIHANAGGGTGWEVFTAFGETISDKYATMFYEEMKEEFPNARFRVDLGDGDVDKEAKFYVLVNTDMPAVLTENFFMDTLNPDCEILFSESGRVKIANAHIRALMRIIKLFN